MTAVLLGLFGITLGTWALLASIGAAISLYREARGEDVSTR